MESFLCNIAAVIVIYEKRIEDSRSFQSIKALAGQGLTIIVFDNSRASQQAPADVSHYYHSQQNLGVSGAYNYAAQKAADSNKSWLWLLDDDTTVDPGFLSEAAALQKKGSHQLMVPKVYSNEQLLSPFGIKNSTTFRIQRLSPGTHNLNSLRPINSGMLISLNAFQKAGGYDPDLPLDFSDIEFTDRLARVFPEFYVTSTRFEQSFSGDEKPTLTKAKDRFKTYIHSARYYAQKASSSRNVQKQVLKRAIRLGLQYFSIYFIGLYRKTRFGS